MTSSQFYLCWLSIIIVTGRGSVFAQAASASESNGRCLESTVMTCRRIGFTHVTLNNVMDWSATQDEIAGEIERLMPVVESQCSEEILPLLCAAYLPACDPATGQRLAPCKDTCRRVMSKTCKGKVKELGFKSDEVFSCGNYPTKRREDQCLKDFNNFKLGALQFSVERVSAASGVINIHGAASPPSGEGARYEGIYFSTEGDDGNTLNSTDNSINIALSSPSQYTVLLRSMTRTGASSYGEAILHPFIYEHCEAISLPVCSNISYTHTQYPNLLGHGTQEQAAEEVQVMLGRYRQHCMPDMEAFLCVLHAPPCTSNDLNRTVIIPPCREMCQQVADGCNSENISSLVQTCDNLPSMHDKERRCYMNEEFSVWPVDGESGRLIAPEGEDLNVFCSAAFPHSHPHWLGPDGTEITSEASGTDSVINTAIGNVTSMLTIPSLSPRNAGEFICLFGNRRSPISIFVEGYYLELDDGDTHSISSPNFPNGYPENEDITWRITVPDGCRLLVSFQRFLVDFGDSVLIAKGPNVSTDNYYWYQTGSAAPSNLNVNSTVTSVKFRSDRYGSRLQYDGFSANLRPVCEDIPPPSVDTRGWGVFLGAGESYSISSPNYPRYYPSDQNIKWVMIIPEDCRLRITFLEFQTQKTWDSVVIGAGMYTSVRRATLSGPLSPEPLVVEARRVYIQFTTNGYTSGRGFRADLDVLCGPEEEVTTTPVPVTEGYPDGIPVPVAANSIANITSPNYPENYPSDISRTWTVTVPAGCQLRIHFNDFYTEQGYDNMRIGHTGTVNTFLWGAQTFTGHAGSRTPEDYVVDAERVWIYFSSDASTTYRGFHLSLSAECDPGVEAALNNSTESAATTASTTPNPNDVRLEENGAIVNVSSPNYPDPYPARILNTWTVTAPEGCQILVHFNDFITESHFDNVYVGHEGTIDTFKSYAVKLSGSTIPDDYTANADTVWIQLSTDFTRVERGFHASLRAICASGSITPQSSTPDSTTPESTTPDSTTPDVGSGTTERALVCSSCSELMSSSPLIPFTGGNCQESGGDTIDCTDIGSCGETAFNVIYTHQFGSDVIISQKTRGCGNPELPANTVLGQNDTEFMNLVSTLQEAMGPGPPPETGLTFNRIEGSICQCDTGPNCNQAPPCGGDQAVQAVTAGSPLVCSVCSELVSSSPLIPITGGNCMETGGETVVCTGISSCTEIAVNVIYQHEALGDVTISHKSRGCGNVGFPSNTLVSHSDPEFDTVASTIRNAMGSGPPPESGLTFQRIEGSICQCDTGPKCNQEPRCGLDQSSESGVDEESQGTSETTAVPAPVELICSICFEEISSNPNISLRHQNSIPCMESGGLTETCTATRNCRNMTIDMVFRHETHGEFTVTHRERSCGSPNAAPNECAPDEVFSVFGSIARASLEEHFQGSDIVFQELSGSMCFCNTENNCNQMHELGDPESGAEEPSPEPEPTLGMEHTTESAEVLGRSYAIIDRGLMQFFRGWTDVQGQGAANDFCRIVLAEGKPFLSCLLAGSDEDNVLSYTSPNPGAEWFDPGYSNTWYMRDKDGDGRDDYCRCVGSVPNTSVVCMKAGPDGFIGQDQDFTPEGAPTDCFYLIADPYFGFP